MRAEFGTHPLEIPHTSRLSRTVRALTGSGRFYLPVILALSGAASIPTPTSKAAGPECDNTRILVVGVGYVDNLFVPNRLKQADSGDWAVGSPEFGIAVVDRINNPKDPNSERVEIARGNLVNRGDYTSALFSLTGLSNTRSSDGSEAMEVAWYFDGDRPAKPSIRTVVKCGYTVPVWGGRSAPLSEIEKALNNPQYEFRTVASVVNEAMRTVTGKSAGLGPEKALQAEVRRALREFADKEKAKTSTPTITSTPTSTATAIATSTPGSTEIPILISTSEGTAVETNASVIERLRNGASRDLLWVFLAGIFGGSALTSLAILLRRKSWRRRRAQTTNEVRVKVPDIVFRVKSQIEDPRVVEVGIKVPAAKAFIEGQSKRSRKPKK